MIRRPVILQGMHGIGDNLHERAIVRELMRDHEVWFKTSFPQLYWDLVPAIHLLPLHSPISWMAKNELRCAALYGTDEPPAGARVVRCAYPWPDARRTSVLEAMAKYCGVPVGDFRLPIAHAWKRSADRLLARLKPTRPLLVTRPLLAIDDQRNPRSARAKLARNPEFDAYAELFARLRERYFVVSIADTQPGVEWPIGPRLAADAEFHHGEVDIETLAALTARASLVYCSPCFLTVLAQAVDTPLICVFGGFEGANSFAAGPARWLPIEPRHACRCWTWNCRHNKTIDVAAAAARIEHFIDAETADAAHAREPLEAAGARAAA